MTRWLTGISLIGSSLARFACREGLAGYISIATRRVKTLKRAEELKLGDHYTTDAKEAALGPDLVVLSVPGGCSSVVAEDITPAFKNGAILTNVGSAKASVIAQIISPCTRPAASWTRCRKSGVAIAICMAQC
ncbi:hypothetical protein CK222_30915 [Mesorhizobium sp. WSM3866]|nr:hypothetical protein CK222_30915 [Mesorhizobium sp. WSM3866]